MLPNWFWEKLSAEHKMIASAPLHFTFALIVLLLVGWWILRFTYRERIEAQAHLIALYNDKFGFLVADSKTPLGRLHNHKLKAQAEKVATAIDKLIEKLELSTQEHIQATRIGDMNHNRLTGMYQHVGAIYEKGLKQDAILLRAEMNSRIVSQGVQDPGSPVGGMGAFAYERPTNSFGFIEVASDLRRLSRLLP